MTSNKISPEQQEKIRACKTSEEILQLAQEEGYELSDEELEDVAGGGAWGSSTRCSKCGSDNVIEYQANIHSGRIVHECRGCGNSW